MAEIDPIRRAEIGREKRARTRATLIEAAYALFSGRPVESITVDDIVKAAGVARGTFYAHFVDLPALIAAVETELVNSVDELLQPARLAMDDPLLRIAFGCSRFLDKAAEDPGWARIVARMWTRIPAGAETAARRLREDLTLLSRASPGVVKPALAREIVRGLMLWLVGALGEGRLAASDRDPLLAALLRAVGAEPARIAGVIALLPPVQESPPRKKAAARA
ncbi:MAG: TetR family transcriptional regulator [Hyphomicrobiales bacterium]|nr:TetR family transcriptional regulator [Hyphomicrobiales bacterium]